MVQERKARLTGVALVATGAVLFSGKAVIIKLAYRYGVDAGTLLALRMLLSAPFFALAGWWAVRGAGGRPLAWPDRGWLVGLGPICYYLAHYLYFLRLQYVNPAPPG